MIKIFTLWITTLLVVTNASADVAYAPKLSLRLSNGLIKNVGPNGGSGTSIVAPDLVFLYFLRKNLAVGLGYYADLNFDQGIASRNGPNISARYYFLGDGTRDKRETSEVTVMSKDTPAFYFGTEYSIRNYYLGSNSNDITQFNVTGTFSTVNAQVGADINLSPVFDLNLEFNYGAFAFAASDNRFVIQSTLLLVGVTYTFW